MKEETLKTSNQNLVQFLTSALLERKMVTLDRWGPPGPGAAGPSGSSWTVQVLPGPHFR